MQRDLCKRPRDKCLMQLGHFTGNTGLTVRHVAGTEILKRFNKASGRLKQHMGMSGHLQFGDELTPGSSATWQKADIGKPVCWQSGSRERCNRTGYAGHRRHGETGLTNLSDQTITRIIDQRSSGITDQCHAPARPQMFNDLYCRRSLIVFMTCHHRR